jgi:hypothetical protein
MNSSVIAFCVLGLLVTVSQGCGGSSSEEEERIRLEERASEEAERAAEEAERAAEEVERELARVEERLRERGVDEETESLGEVLGELGRSLGGEPSVTPVDFRELRDLLPERIRGMEQTANSGERTGALGIKISKAERTFTSDEGYREIDLSIVDLGSLKNAAMLGFDWLQLDVDREDDRGFERTTEFNGHPAMEKCEKHDDVEQCSLHVIVAQRFVVQVEARGVPFDDVRDLVDDMDLKQLDKMRYEGVREVE